MKITCPDCRREFDDVYRLTYCPHDEFPTRTVIGGVGPDGQYRQAMAHTVEEASTFARLIRAGEAVPSERAREAEAQDAIAGLVTEAMLEGQAERRKLDEVEAELMSCKYPPCQHLRRALDIIRRPPHPDSADVVRLMDATRRQLAHSADYNELARGEA